MGHPQAQRKHAMAYWRERQAQNAARQTTERDAEVQHMASYISLNPSRETLTRKMQMDLAWHQQKIVELQALLEEMANDG